MNRLPSLSPLLRGLALSLACLALVPGGAAHAQPARTSRVSTAGVLGEQALVGMQIGLRKQAKAGQVPAPLIDCVNRLAPDSFTTLFDTMLGAALTPDERKAADTFYASPTGQKVARLARIQNYTNGGEAAPEAAPVYADADSKSYAAFVNTSAGIKLFDKRVLETPAARQKVVGRIEELLKSCGAGK